MLKNNETILSNNKYIFIILFVSTLVCLIPLIFFDEQTISSNELLKKYMNSIVEYYPKIEYYAQIASSNELYHTVKLQLSWSILSFIVAFILSLYILIKVYLCSLGFILSNTLMYNNLTIRNNLSSVSIYKYFSQLIFIIIIISLAFLLNQLPNNEIGYVKESTVIGAFFVSSILSGSFGCLISYIIIETIAQIRKAWLK